MNRTDCRSAARRLMLLTCLPCLTCLMLAAAMPAARASTSASSASSDGASASVGSVSASIEGSSQSSTRDKVAEGEYRVIEIAQAPQRPGLLRVALQGEAGAFQLVLPPQAAQAGRLEVGHTIWARQRGFGIEFAAGQPRQAFFLVMHDAAMPSLQTRAVAL